MAKLQIRFDREQLDMIIDALVHLSHAPALPDHLADAHKLASWLTWRRDKFYGRPAGDAERRADDQTEAIGLWQLAPRKTSV